MPSLVSVGTDKGSAQYSKIQNCEEMDQANISCLAAGKMKCMVCSQIWLPYHSKLLITNCS